MSAAVAGILLALAVLLVPVRRRPRRRPCADSDVVTSQRAQDPRSRRSREAAEAVTSQRAQDRLDARARPARLLIPAAVAAVGCACVALLGLGPGLFAAAVACPAAAMGLRRLPGPDPVPADAALALTLDLAASALRAGRPLSDALARAAPVASPGAADLLGRVAGLLRLGADPAVAWAVLPADGPLAAVAASATRSATSGIRVAIAFERAAEQIRADLAAAAAVRAHRAGVFAMAPLGLCFLPSFVCLGVVPVVVGIAKTAFAVLA